MKWLKRIAIGLAGLIVILVAAVFILSETQLNKTYSVPTPVLNMANSAAQIERGKHLSTAISHCHDCHGPNLEGSVVLDDPMLGRIVAPNLTRGKTGAGNRLSDVDIARIVRYGVRPTNKSVIVMPSEEFTYLSDSDLAAIVAYIRSFPPNDSDPGSSETRLLGRALMAFGLLPIVTAEKINVNLPRPAEPPIGVTAEYGQYLTGVAGCFNCHGPNLSGGPIIGAPPDFPPATNLTPAGAPGKWSEQDFFSTIHTGIDPSGHQLVDPMPWKTYAQMTDDELRAIWLYLKTVPARPYGNH